MQCFELESSRAAYHADFVVYGLTALGLAAALLWGAPPAHWAGLLLAVLAGYGLWGLLEYGLHRFVLHGLPPFNAMHAQHHLRPAARIGTPTMVSLPLFGGLLFAPAWALLGAWPACALMLGLVCGYLLYALMHHACHHALADPMKGPLLGRWTGPLVHSAWFRQRLRWHAQHHRRPAAARCFGVSHGLWDRAFGTPAQGQLA